MKLSQVEKTKLLEILQTRFKSNMQRHAKLSWDHIQEKLLRNDYQLSTLFDMEQAGGEPDVVGYDKANDKYIFMDCSEQSPEGRRNLCFDRDAWEKRKVAKPKSSVEDIAKEMGIELLTEEEYQYLQTLGNFDTKSSSWIQTPQSIRKLGGALFGDRRYDTVFIYHNGADSYYSARGFRGKLLV